jgi:DNA-binding response OmpR family regulator
MLLNNKNRQSRILLVEDEESLAIGLEYNLTHEGYRVTRAEDGRIARDLIQKQSFDLIILDIMLPYHDGFELAEMIRGQSPQMPILMLTARTAAKDRIKGLELGADDYLTKPFHLRELLLRVMGMLKRKEWYQDLSEVGPVYRFGGNEINFETLTGKTIKRDIRLTPHEAMVMKYLILHKGKIVSRKALLENVWHVSSNIETRTVDSFIARLRKYFETEPSKPVHIISIRGAGYKFTDE